ncbi:hypothetical protein ACOBQX_22200 [Actinokineospora sp. G85]|uniref:hypothetical protein n=1 Tax=Actinokineospora sp. G85 TaxID=3406626 RepID=UPI003C78088F
MSPKRNDPVAPPTTGEEWRVKYSKNAAVDGWAELENRAANNLRAAWETMRHDPGPGLGKPTSRHHQLKGGLATGTQDGRPLPRWQLEITSGDRVWYLLDVEKHTVWVEHAGPHPKATD